MGTNLDGPLVGLVQEGVGVLLALLKLLGVGISDLLLLRLLVLVLLGGSGSVFSDSSGGAGGNRGESDGGDECKEGRRGGWTHAIMMIELKVGVG